MTLSERRADLRMPAMASKICAVAPAAGTCPRARPRSSARAPGWSSVWSNEISARPSGRCSSSMPVRFSSVRLGLHDDDRVAAERGEFGRRMRPVAEHRLRQADDGAAQVGVERRRAPRCTCFGQRHCDGTRGCGKLPGPPPPGSGAGRGTLWPGHWISTRIIEFERLFQRNNIAAGWASPSRCCAWLMRRRRQRRPGRPDPVDRAADHLPGQRHGHGSVGRSRRPSPILPRRSTNGTAPVVTSPAPGVGHPAFRSAPRR